MGEATGRRDDIDRLLWEVSLHGFDRGPEIRVSADDEGAVVFVGEGPVTAKLCKMAIWSSRRLMQRVQERVPVACDHHGEFVEFVAHGVGRA